MILRRCLWACLIGVMAGLVLSGCGGGGGRGVTVAITGLYEGTVTGGGQGALKFFVDPSGRLFGNLRARPVCKGPIPITGIATKRNENTWRVRFRGQGCGITFTGKGTIKRSPPGSNQFVGSGTWTGSDGSSGTWEATWTAGTGSVGV